jgi:hypothetical protein
MKIIKANTLIAILTTTIMLLIPITALAGNSTAPVENTVQTISSATGDVSDHQTGVATPKPRFVDNGDGTIKDTLTNLIWLKNANCYGARTWDNATLDAVRLNSGECGLSDGSVEGDWRLPTFEEQSGIRAAPPILNPKNPSGILTIPGAPFLNVQPHYYWTTTNCSATGQAWFSAVGRDSACASATFDDQYVWPVRQPIDTGEMVF